MIDSVLLIRPPGIGKKQLPLGLLYIATMLGKKGFGVRIIDLHDTPKLENNIPDILKNSPNTMLGISALAPHYRWIKHFIKLVKNKSSNVKIIVGGHISILYRNILEKTHADFICLGEGEEVMPQIIDRINSNRDLNDVCGIAFRHKGKIIHNRRCKPIFPFIMPNFELINMENYFIHPNEDMFFRNSYKYRARAMPNDKLAVLMFSRGCVGHCGFCYRHLPGFRQASVDWCWEQLMILYEKYNVRYFRFDDELFTNSFEWLKKFYERIKESKINILFRVTGTRVDQITPEHLKTMQKMGCIALNYGIESGSQTILDKMHKGTTVKQAYHAIYNTRKINMQTMAYIIIGYEGENTLTLKETTMFLLKCGIEPEYVSIFYAVPLPGTTLYRHCLRSNLIDDEEQYLELLSEYIEQKHRAHDYYFINISETNIGNLMKWEKAIMFLLRLSQIVETKSFTMKILRHVVETMPPYRISAQLLDIGYRALSFLRIT